MDEQEFRNEVRNQLKKIISENNFDISKLFINPNSKKDDESKSSMMSSLYRLAMKGQINAAKEKIQNDPQLQKLAADANNSKNELLKKLETDDSFMKFFINFLNDMNTKK